LGCRAADRLQKLPQRSQANLRDRFGPLPGWRPVFEELRHHSRWRRRTRRPDDMKRPATRKTAKLPPPNRRAQFDGGAIPPSIRANSQLENQDRGLAPDRWRIGALSCSGFQPRRNRPPQSRRADPRLEADITWYHL